MPLRGTSGSVERDADPAPAGPVTADDVGAATPLDPPHDSLDAVQIEDADTDDRVRHRAVVMD